MRFLFAVLAYVVVTALFGGPLHPIGLATFWSDRLGVPYWRVMAALCVAASALVFARPFREAISDALRVPIFVSLAILLPTVIVGLYADWIRHRAVLALGADEVEEHSFFRSVREEHREIQRFLHTAALKDCTPYAWSYSKMAFYVLSPNVGANVLPQRWINRCAIRIDRR